MSNISRLDSYEKIVAAVGNSDLPQMFFTQPQVMHNFLNNIGIEFYSITNENRTYFFIHKTKHNELRLLFTLYPSEVISELTKQFNPQFIAYNLLVENSRKEDSLEDVEVVMDIDAFVNLKDTRIRKHYNQALRQNTHLVFKPFENIPTHDLKEFWRTWAQQRAAVSEKFTDRTSNDQRFLELFNDAQYFGIAAYDGPALVAYSIGIRHGVTYCLSGFNKTLRGYTNLGLQVSYEKAKIAQELGYQKMNVGSINNDFKKHFLPISDQLLTYAFELWRKESFKTFNTQRFIQAFWI